MALVTTIHSDWLNLVNRYADSIRFGVIQIVIHEGNVVQVDRTEKVRFDKPKIEGKEFLKVNRNNGDEA